MPVVISLLNAFTGLAVALGGFELENNVLIVAGMLVGASGTLLTLMMARAMNRSIANVLFGAFGQVSEAAAAVAAGDGGGTVRSASAEDVAVMLAYAHKVVFVPGYGLAVAQAQHDVRQLADLLESKGVEVSYAIHPVAGRMPGHMNVLLAEANVPYPQLKEMDEANPEFSRTDVAVVVGANDVVNPDARTNQGSPIYGMPILNVDDAQTVVVLKRSMNPGFAGIENPLFYNPKTVMLFGDAKESIDQLIADVKPSDSSRSWRFARWEARELRGPESVGFPARFVLSSLGRIPRTARALSHAARARQRPARARFGLRLSHRFAGCLAASGLWALS